jgi:hypothetical protein
MAWQDRLKRGWIALTVLTFVGFGLHAAVSFYRSVEAGEGYTEWSARYDEADDRARAAAAECKTAPPDSYLCSNARLAAETRSDAAGIRNMYRRSMVEKDEAAAISLVAAVATPFVAAFIFFLARWIFTGRWRRQDHT